MRKTVYQTVNLSKGGKKKLKIDITINFDLVFSAVQAHIINQIN